MDTTKSDGSNPTHIHKPSSKQRRRMRKKREKNDNEPAHDQNIIAEGDSIPELHRIPANEITDDVESLTNSSSVSSIEESPADHKVDKSSNFASFDINDNGELSPTVITGQAGNESSDQIIKETEIALDSIGVHDLPKQISQDRNLHEENDLNGILASAPNQQIVTLEEKCTKLEIALREASQKNEATERQVKNLSEENSLLQRKILKFNEKLFLSALREETLEKEKSSQLQIVKERDTFAKSLSIQISKLEGDLNLANSLLKEKELESIELSKESNQTRLKLRDTEEIVLQKEKEMSSIKEQLYFQSEKSVSLNESVSHLNHEIQIIQSKLEREQVKSDEVLKRSLNTAQIFMDEIDALKQQTTDLCDQLEETNELKKEVEKENESLKNTNLLLNTFLKEKDDELERVRGEIKNKEYRLTEVKEELWKMQSIVKEGLEEARSLHLMNIELRKLVEMKENDYESALKAVSSDLDKTFVEKKILEDKVSYFAKEKVEWEEKIKNVESLLKKREEENKAMECEMSKVISLFQEKSSLVESMGTKLIELENLVESKDKKSKEHEVFCESIQKEKDALSQELRALSISLVEKDESVVTLTRNLSVIKSKCEKMEVEKEAINLDYSKTKSTLEKKETEIEEITGVLNATLAEKEEKEIQAENLKRNLSSLNVKMEEMNGKLSEMQIERKSNAEKLGSLNLELENFQTLTKSREKEFEREKECQEKELIDLNSKLKELMLEKTLWLQKENTMKDDEEKLKNFISTVQKQARDDQQVLESKISSLENQRNFEIAEKEKKIADMIQLENDWKKKETEIVESERDSRNKLEQSLVLISKLENNLKEKEFTLRSLEEKVKNMVSDTENVVTNLKQEIETKEKEKCDSASELERHIKEKNEMESRFRTKILENEKILSKLETELSSKNDSLKHTQGELSKMISEKTNALLMIEEFKGKELKYLELEAETKSMISQKQMDILSLEQRLREKSESLKDTESRLNELASEKQAVISSLEQQLNDVTNTFNDIQFRFNQVSREKDDAFLKFDRDLKDKSSFIQNLEKRVEILTLDRDISIRQLSEELKVKEAAIVESKEKFNEIVAANHRLVSMIEVETLKKDAEIQDILQSNAQERSMKDNLILDLQTKFTEKQKDFEMKEEECIKLKESVVHLEKKIREMEGINTSLQNSFRIQLDNAEKTIQELKANEEVLSKEICSSRDSIVQIQDDLAKCQKAKEVVEQELKSSKDDVSQLENAARSRESQLKKLEKAREEEKQVVEQIIEKLRSELRSANLKAEMNNILEKDLSTKQETITNLEKDLKMQKEQKEQMELSMKKEHSVFNAVITKLKSQLKEEESKKNENLVQLRGVVHHLKTVLPIYKGNLAAIREEMKTNSFEFLLSITEAENKVEESVSKWRECMNQQLLSKDNLLKVKMEEWEKEKEEDDQEMEKINEKMKLILNEKMEIFEEMNCKIMLLEKEIEDENNQKIARVKHFNEVIEEKDKTIEHMADELLSQTDDIVKLNEKIREAAEKIYKLEMINKRVLEEFKTYKLRLKTMEEVLEEKEVRLVGMEKERGELLVQKDSWIASNDELKKSLMSHESKIESKDCELKELKNSNVSLLTSLEEKDRKVSSLYETLRLKEQEVEFKGKECEELATRIYKLTTSLDEKVKHNVELEKEKKTVIFQNQSLNFKMEETEKELISMRNLTKAKEELVKLKENEINDLLLRIQNLASSLDQKEKEMESLKILASESEEKNKKDLNDLTVKNQSLILSVEEKEKEIVLLKRLVNEKDERIEVKNKEYETISIQNRSLSDFVSEKAKEIERLEREREELNFALTDMSMRLKVRNATIQELQASIRGVQDKIKEMEEERICANVKAKEEEARKERHVNEVINHLKDSISLMENEDKKKEESILLLRSALEQKEKEMECLKKSTEEARRLDEIKRNVFVRRLKELQDDAIALKRMADEYEREAKVVKESISERQIRVKVIRAWQDISAASKIPFLLRIIPGLLALRKYFLNRQMGRLLQTPNSDSHHLKPLNELDNESDTSHSSPSRLAAFFLFALPFVGSSPKFFERKSAPEGKESFWRRLDTVTAGYWRPRNTITTSNNVGDLAGIATKDDDEDSDRSDAGNDIENDKNDDENDGTESMMTRVSWTG